MTNEFASSLSLERRLRGGPKRKEEKDRGDRGGEVGGDISRTQTAEQQREGEGGGWEPKN